MKHEKILKRDDGTKVKILIDFSVSWKNDTSWRVDIAVCPPKKRTWVWVVDTNNYEYRSMPFPHGRQGWADKKNMEYVTEVEIFEAKMELWELLKPAK